jgi:hypothetical protein
MSNRCQYCQRPFIRSHPAQRFCGKVRGRHVCKDAYHNTRRALTGDLSQARRNFVKGRQVATPDNCTSVARAIDPHYESSWDQYVNSIPFGSEESFESPF